VALEYRGDESLIIEGDRPKLATAVLELVRNAVKATPEGGQIAIGANALNGYYQLYVSDTGVGIEPERLRGLMSEDVLNFLDMSDTRPYEGGGFGLMVVRHVVQLHGGTIEAESTPGKGSVFRIKLPRHE
jgi:signal transduction histidine kinase